MWGLWESYKGDAILWGEPSCNWCEAEKEILIQPVGDIEGSWSGGMCAPEYIGWVC